MISGFRVWDATHRFSQRPLLKGLGFRVLCLGFITYQGFARQGRHEHKQANNQNKKPIRIHIFVIYVLVHTFISF